VTEATKFEQWVKQYGVQNLVDALRKRGMEYAVTYSAVYQWLRGEHEPRPKKIRALADISAGAITVQDIHDHFQARAVVSPFSFSVCGPLCAFFLYLCSLRERLLPVRSGMRVGSEKMSVLALNIGVWLYALLA